MPCKCSEPKGAGSMCHDALPKETAPVATRRCRQTRGGELPSFSSVPQVDAASAEKLSSSCWSAWPAESTHALPWQRFGCVAWDTQVAQGSNDVRARRGPRLHGCDLIALRITHVHLAGYVGAWGVSGNYGARSIEAASSLLLVSRNSTNAGGSLVHDAHLERGLHGRDVCSSLAVES
jgi:hypothetical protein